jgi:hypothetical protein
LTRRSLRASALAALVCLVPLAAGAQGRATSPAAANELDAFMAKVLKRREINRQMLDQYVLDEQEQFEVLGPSRMPVYRQKREFTWYVRDGLHVRSPVRFDGVSVGDDARKQYEDNWSKRERSRLEQEKKKKTEKAGQEPASPEPEALPDDPAGLGASPIPTPRFVSEAYFMDFKFEAGNYYLAGREQLEGKSVLRIEYYPTRMFGGDDDRDARRERERGARRNDDRAKREEERIERQMNKTALVTLWVDPVEHQIVKYTFDNVWMDFLPGKWLVRVDDIKASMTMSQPFPDVWLPREMNIHAGVTIAAGSLEAAYERRFANYKLAETRTIIRVPKRDPQDDADEVFFPEPDQDPAPAAPQEVVTEVRVHGNAYLRDDEVVRLSGVKLGQTLGPDGVREIKQRLERSGYFETVEIRKGYRSLEMGGDVSLVLLVHERPGQTSELAGDGPSTTPWKRLKSRLMFLPIVDYTDGYGLTYGGRVSTVDLLGAGERISTPLTWGGTRRAAVEVERTFKRGPLSRVQSTFGILQRENPRFEIDDRRITWTARAERSFAGLVRAGLETSRSAVDFAALDDRLWTVGADVTLDTRGDPAFPRNAVLLGTSWTRLHVSPAAGEPGATDINRYTTDARGYLGVVRQAVVAGRVLYSTADRTLPPYERLLLGGSSTLRGFASGTYDGDRLLATSAELRVPITSVLSGAKLGVVAFVDAAKTFDVGRRASDVEWHRGVGGGVFLIATIVRLNLDVAHGLKDGTTRVHLAMGFSF